MQPVANRRNQAACTPLACILAMALLVTGALAEDKSLPVSPTVNFESAVAPIFKAKCTRCHGERTRKGELDLSSTAGIRKGGASGEVITPGKLDESPLYELVHEDQMPPEGEKPRLTKQEVVTIGNWILSGAQFTSAGNLAKEPFAAAELSQHDVIPILLLRCTVCHGIRKQEGGLDLRTRASMLKGGKSGPAIVPGDPESSLLVKRVRAGEMPPPRLVAEASVKPMPAPELEKIAAWIKGGAAELDVLPDIATTEPDPMVSDEDRKFWSFQPPRPQVPPLVHDVSRVRNAIDAFVLEKLEARDLSLSPEADRRTLLRRAYFDLTGLPPEPEEVDAFLADTSPEAYESLLDRLLASPRYGERWGRYWLDVAGYSDSEGFTFPDVVRSDAYRYRDYVIRSFNADKPYDRFLLEQIAGDELADYEHAGAITAEIYDNLVATGFLRMAPDGTWHRITNFVPFRLDVIADEIQVLASGVMGLTLSCARCHNHKFDPLPQRDYYRLAAILKPALDEHDWMMAKTRHLPYVTQEEKELIAQQNERLDQEIAALKTALAQQKTAAQRVLFDTRLAALPEALREDLKKTFDTPAEERTEVQKYLAEKFAAQLELSDAALAEADAQYKKQSDEAAATIKTLESQKQSPVVRALWDRGAPSNTYLLKRGDYQNPGRLVGPGVPSVLTDGKTLFEVVPPYPGAKSTGRRLALARWLTQADHPLTARVMVNRVWRHHFGRGIVASLGDFGLAGSPPSHRELLDWLSGQFVNSNWSIKQLHRLIMTSSTYRQSSVVQPEAARIDPDGSLLSRMALRRVEGEVVYDSLLLVAGELDETPFGVPDAVDVRADGLVSARKSGRGWRRSIYVQQRRTEMLTVLDSFDFPQMSPHCLQRQHSTVATQALYLMNNAFVHDLARRFAERVRREAGSDVARELELAYKIALARSPGEGELKTARDALEVFTRHWLNSPAKPGELASAAANEASLRALANICHALMNSSEFLYVD